MLIWVRHKQTGQPEKTWRRGEQLMKKNIIIGIAMAIGVISAGALSASAASACSGDSRCTDAQVYQKFSQEASSLFSTMKAKDFELREQYGYDRVDPRKISKLEAEIKELKGQIQHIAEKHGVLPCCIS
jgi:hypothetical protein